MILVLTVLSTACGGGGGSSSSSSTPSAQTRSYLLAQTGMQIVPYKPFADQSPDVATDADLFSIHDDFYGVPWDEFAAGLEPPAEWAAFMDTLAQRASNANKGVFLSLALVQDGVGRQYLAQKAVVQNGQLTRVGEWSAPCYDFATAPDGATLKTAYTRYVDWMVRKFRPRYVNVAVEMNLFLISCSGSWDGLVDVERAAYDAAKAAQPGVIAFPSIQIDQLYGYMDDCTTPQSRNLCYDANYAKLAQLKRDRFAISTYPYSTTGLGMVSRIPADWFTRAGDRGGERTVVAETGWLSEAPVIDSPNGCFTGAIDAPSLSEAGETAYLDLLLTTAQAHNMDLVTYWSNRDLIPAGMMTSCPCSYDAQWCGFLDLWRSLSADPVLGELTFKAFGTMGIRRYDGTPKGTIFQRWKKAQGLTVKPQ